MRFNLRYESDEGGKVIEFATGRTSLWDAQDYANTIPESVNKRAKVDYAWAFYAAQQAGKLGELGVPDGCGVEDGLRYLADNYDFSVVKDDEEDAPLASEPAK